MSHGKGVPQWMNAYLRDRAEEWIAAEKGRTAAALAEKIGVTDAQISVLRNHARGAGWQTLKGFAKLLNVSVDEIEARAKAEWESRPRDLRYEEPDPAPNRTAALAPFVDDPDPIVREAARQIASAEHDEGIHARTREQWTRDLMRRIEDLRQDALNPARVEERKAASAATAARLLAEKDAHRRAARAESDRLARLALERGEGGPRVERDEAPVAPTKKTKGK